MPVPTTLVGGLKLPVCLRARAADLVVGQRRGALVSVDLTSGATATLTTLPGWLRTFDLSADGLTAYAGGSTLGLVAAPLDGDPPIRLMRRVGRPGALLVEGSGDAVLVAEGRQPGRVFRLQLQPRAGSIVARGLPRLRGLLQDVAGGRFLAVDEAGELLSLDGVVLSDGLGRPADVAWLDDRRVVVADAAGGRVLQVDLDHPGDAPAVLCDGLARLWGARVLTDGRLAIGAGEEILVLDLPAVQPARVELHVRRGELFIGGWVRVGVTVNDASISFDDLDFMVDPQRGGELVSLSRDNSFDPQAPTIVLSAGWLTGRHTLSAVRRSDGTTVGTAEFEVLDTWTDRKWGPSVATFGSVLAGPDSGTWGGPDSGDYSVPQNVEVNKAIGTYRVGVVLVETAEPNAQYPANVAPTITSLQDELVNGVAIGGITRSVADYFAQASNGLLAVDFVGPVGPVALPNNWASYFTMNAQNQWVYNDDLASIIIAEIVARNEDAGAAGDPLFLDLATLDSVLYVVRSRPAAPMTPRLSVWPRASRTKVSHIIGSVPLAFGLSVPVFRPLARIFMPDDWATDPNSGRAMHETVSHELGHNLGLADQYNRSYAADVANRITGGPQAAATNPTGAGRGTWELMTWEENLPLPSAAHRLMLGWLPADRVRLYNFGVFGPVDQKITLHAAGGGAIPAGRWGAAEVRIEDGLNYYLEYRPAVAGRTVDISVPQADAVVLTEALTRMPEPTDRAQILLAKDDADLVVERGSFVIGEDYRERDVTTPKFEQDFIVDVVATTADAARVRVRYAADTKPDPGIRPWVPANNWQSPDFEVVNARNQADPSFRNIPWEGQPNTLRVRVHNWGTADAHDVRVRFFVKDFTLGTGAEQDLGDAVATIPSKSSVVLDAPKSWIPPVLQLPFPFPLGTLTYQQHSCAVARVDEFLDPVSSIWEVTPENNEAQSNFTWTASATSSPATREVTTLLLENPWDVPAVMSLTVRQPHPLFRVYLDHAWVRLEPGEQQRVLLMVESLLGDERFAELVEEFAHGERRIESTMRLSMYGDDLSSCAPTLVGGAAVLTMTGRGTHFEGFEVDGGLAHGRIVDTASGSGVDGRMLVAVNPVDPDAGDDALVREGDVEDGRFRIEHGRAEHGLWSFTAYYVGRFPWLPCESETLRP